MSIVLESKDRGVAFTDGEEVPVLYRNGLFAPDAGPAPYDVLVIRGGRFLVNLKKGKKINVSPVRWKGWPGR